jgi:hypothetical protein
MSLNQYTGRSNGSLERSHAKKRAFLMKLRRDDDVELGGGSPLEHFYEDLDALEGEMKRRGMDIAPVCATCRDEEKAEAGIETVWCPDCQPAERAGTRAE